jgi:CheY-like chemotaxis protein
VEIDNSAAAYRMRILVVEDHDDTREVLANLLRHIGHEVFAAASSGEALKAIGTAKMDVMVSDIGLPDGSGYALLAQARQVQPTMRAVALTGFGTAQDARFSREAGFDFHLTKPLDFHELRTALAQISNPASAHPSADRSADGQL